MTKKYKKILEICEMLDRCPQTRAALPCDPDKFKKALFLMDNDMLDKLYGALSLELKLSK